MEQKRWHPSSWSGQTVWRIHMWAGALSSGLVLTGVGLAVIAGVASARNKPNEAFLTRLEIVGWVLLVLGVVLGFVFVLTRNAEKPRPFAIRLHVPHPPSYEFIDTTTYGEPALVLHEMWLINESDEIVSLEFRLHGEGPTLGMRPYRTFYRNNRSELKDRYLSNPRHLGRREQAEADLPFMSEDHRFPSMDSYESLGIVVTPPGQEYRIAIRTPEEGHVIEGEVNSQSNPGTQEPQTRTTE